MGGPRSLPYNIVSQLFFIIWHQCHMSFHITNYQRNWENNTTCNCIKKIKYLGVNLTKEVKDLYTGNYKTLMKGIEEGPNKWKHILCSQIGRVLLKCPFYPKKSTVYKFSGISIRTPVSFSTEIEKTILKFVWNHKRP